MVRVAIVQPGLGIGLPDELVGVRWPAYVGIAALAVVVAGGWISIGDERTDARGERDDAASGAPRATRADLSPGPRSPIIERG